MTPEIQAAIDRAVQALKACGAKEVYLFGSAATGKMRDNSDLDLAVSGVPPRLFFRAMSLATDAAGRPLDVVDLDEETPFAQYLREEKELVRVG